jgi:hypothetical protein
MFVLLVEIDAVPEFESLWSIACTGIDFGLDEVPFPIAIPHMVCMDFHIWLVWNDNLV